MAKRSSSSLVRLIVPDSHGSHVDEAAMAAMLRDAAGLNVNEIVLIGDHMDCGGTFNAHQRTYTNELTESYEDDAGACNRLLDGLAKACPKARGWYLEGNHEQHVERWASRQFVSRKDAEGLLARYAPAAVLRLRTRGITYIKRSEFYMGLSIPGTIRLGKCFFVHGISHSKNCAERHLNRFGASVVFGHVHRSQSVVSRTVASDGHGAWCPGTLAKLQPLYRHTEPTEWTHGYGLQFVTREGRFMHLNVPLIRGESLLSGLIKRNKP